MVSNIASEFELYEPMRQWLERRLLDKFPSLEIITLDAHSERLDRVLHRYGVISELANGVDIQIDILGIVKGIDGYKLYFIEAKKTDLTLRDLGQLWAYCKLIDPAEAFLMTSAGLGSLSKLIGVFKREDLLNFGDQKYIKMMQLGVWDVSSNAPEASTMIPKI